MKFGSQNKSNYKSNILIINVLIEFDVLDPKLQICEIWYQKLKCAPIFMKFGVGANGTC